MDKVSLNLLYGQLPSLSKATKLDGLAPPNVIKSLGETIKLIVANGYDGVRYCCMPQDVQGNFLLGLMYNLESPEGIAVKMLVDKLPIQKIPFNATECLQVIELIYRRLGLTVPKQSENTGATI